MWLPINAEAKPLEARSENFVVYGSLSEASARDLLEELENYRAAILQLLRVDVGPEVMPVRIYVASGPKEIELLTGSAGSSGVYLTQIEGPAFVLNSRAGFTRGKQALGTALHEYTHHLLASFTQANYPRWFDEGFAEYLSTFTINRDGHLVIGQPDEDHAYALRNINWLPVDVLLRSVRGYPFPNDNSRNTRLLKSVFYGQSWLAVHYIQSTPGYPEKLAKYVQILNSPNTPSNAFEQAFGMPPQDFGKIMQAYYKRNRFLTTTIKLPEDRPEPVIKIKEVTKEETSLHMAEAIRHFRLNEKGWDAAQKFYAKARKDFSLDAKIKTSQAAFLSGIGKHDEALEQITDMLEVNPQDSHINRVAGMVWFRKNDHDKEPNMAEIQKSRKLLKSAMRINADNVPAHFYYVQTYIVSHDKPSAQASASALKGLDYYRSVNFVNSNVDFAEVLIKSGQEADAKAPLLQAMAWSRSRDVRAYARSQLRQLSSR